MTPSKRTGLIIVFVLLLAFKSIYSQTSATPTVYIQVDWEVLKLFNIRERDSLRTLIENRLKGDFYNAWTEMESKIGSLPGCYKDAFDKYKEILQIYFNNEFIINFNFTEDFITYQVAKGLWFKIKNFPGDHSGNAKINGKNEITVFNVYAPQWSLIKYSKDTPNCSYEYLLSDVQNYLLKNQYDQRTDYDLLKKHNWTENAGRVNFTLKNMIVHEIFHLVLAHAPDNNLKSRFGDEATISDTTARIFSLAGGKGFYGYSYRFVSWVLDNKDKIVIPLKSASSYIIEDFYYDKGNDRKFDPPKSLKYEPGGYTLGGLRPYYPANKTERAADDCRCNKMQPYIIPKKCCKPI